MLSSRFIVAAVLALIVVPIAHAAAPKIFHTPNFESPVRGGPGDLLYLGGAGFGANDRVVYEAVRDGQKRMDHPATVPSRSTRELGTASVVKIGDPPYSMTIRLPEEFSKDVAYRLWVVNAASEWSESASVNDPRPLWVSPAFVYATQDFADLGRRIRIMGRNLGSNTPGPALRIRLLGPQTYTLEGLRPSPAALIPYVAEVALPQRMVPGSYTASVGRGGSGWVEVPGQRLEVVADPLAPAHFSLGSPDFGSCRPNDSQDDSECLAKAIAAAQRAGGAVVDIPAGTWDLFPAGSQSDREAEFVLTRNIRLQGAGAADTTLARRVASPISTRPALFLLEGDNSITRLQFVDEQRFDSFESSRPVIRLGHRWDDPRVEAGSVPGSARRIVISNNVFRRVGMAVDNSGLPLEQLIITHNDFGGYARGLELPGSRISLKNLFRIDDAVIRWNRFVPGSYVDVSAGQGAIATGLGASRRVDFSSNEADGSSAEALQDPLDQHGWRAAFFWNMSNNGEMLLVSDNHVSCSGDKAGDGEAVAFDGNGNTFGYKQAQQVTGADAGSVAVPGELLAQQYGKPVDPQRYYPGQWIQVVSGPGLGQTRRIERVVRSARGATMLEVSPHWDVIPAVNQSSIVVSRQFWQTYVIGNEITQATPPCRKSNLSGPHGGEITLWAPTADSVIDGNHQADTNGIGFTQGYSVQAPSCPRCDSHVTVQSALEIRNNIVDGEYDWGSDCSWSGVHGTFGASPTPEAPPPIVSFGVQIVHNVISRSDGLRGGAIDIVPTWFRGPDPQRWPLIDNLLIAGNIIRDMNGPEPRPSCRRGQHGRVGIRIEGAANVRGTVLYGNSCERVDQPLEDSGVGTTRMCVSAAVGSCECEVSKH